MTTAAADRSSAAAPVGQKTIVTIVVAVARNGVIGRGGRLPWRLPSDLKLFKAATLGKPVVMGRKTFQSIGKPLPGRENIVVTRDANFAAAGTHRATSLEAAIELGSRLAGAAGAAASEVVVIGGSEIYALALGLADRILLTEVHATVEGDAHFPPLDPAQWQERGRTRGERGPRDEFDFDIVVLERRRQQAKRDVT